MHNNTSFPNDINYIDIQEYKECFGKNCKNNAVHNLKIKYINKIGHFCQRCTDDLLRSELGVKIQQEQI